MAGEEKSKTFRAAALHAEPLVLDPSGEMRFAMIISIYFDSQRITRFSRLRENFLAESLTILQRYFCHFDGETVPFRSETPDRHAA